MYADGDYDDKVEEKFIAPDTNARLQKKRMSRAEDPHDLFDRYIRTHACHFNDALSEIRNGRKSSCWMWYIFPTPPWIVNGREQGSWTNQKYSLRSDAQAEAYLKMEVDGVNLRFVYFCSVVRFSVHCFLSGVFYCCIVICGALVSCLRRRAAVVNAAFYPTTPLVHFPVPPPHQTSFFSPRPAATTSRSRLRCATSSRAATR